MNIVRIKLTLKGKDHEISIVEARELRDQLNKLFDLADPVNPAYIPIPIPIPSFPWPSYPWPSYPYPQGPTSTGDPLPPNPTFICMTIGADEIYHVGS